MKFSTGPDGTLGVELDIEQIVSQRWDGILGLFGRDAASSHLKEWIKERTREALETASYVKIVGMTKPVLLKDIYQPTNLVVSGWHTSPAQTHIADIVALPDLTGSSSGRETQTDRSRNTPIQSQLTTDLFLSERLNSIIKAGPGWGKTTFLHALFLRLLHAEDGVLPLLFTLRERSSIEHLEYLVDLLRHIDPKKHSQPLLLLVDGYDEVPTAIREKVSELLHVYSSQKAGQFFLTCRDNYDVYGIKAREVKIGDFGVNEQLNFMRAYFRQFERSDLDAKAILQDLRNRGFEDILRHPLLLMLACIIKTNDLDVRIRGTASLIETALNSLSLRWDQEKPIRREATTPLNSIQRLNLLKKLAYTLGLGSSSQSTAIEVAQAMLDKMSYRDVEPLDVLREIAQFYGIFVPIGSKWGFVHRSIKDYLAAQEWVESGEFSAAAAAGKLPVDSRTAFAACRRPDATDVMVQVLTTREGIPIFREIMLNEPSFDMGKVLEAIKNFYNQQALPKANELNSFEGLSLYANGWACTYSPAALWTKFDCNLIEDASDRFLDYILQECCGGTEKIDDALIGHAILSFRDRNLPITKSSFEALKKKFQHDDYFFTVMGKGNIKLNEISHL